MDTRRNSGFTLIEMSIVLVIIGLIVGGVLVGRDLIHAASVRAQVAQIEKYNAAVNSFRLKYNALPGDMIPAVAATYGLLQMNNTTGAQGVGDGNGVLEDGQAFGQNCNGSPNMNQFAGEIMTFWRHLSDASLVDGQFGTTGNSAIVAANCSVTGVITNIYQSIPPAKIGHGMSITVMSGRGTNYYVLLPVSIINGFGNYNLAGGTGRGLSPIEASNIDTKVDDGQPETGIVLALGLYEPDTPGTYGSASQAELIGGHPPSAAATSTLNKCVISSDSSGALATDTYNLVPSTGGTDQSCMLAIRFQ